MIIDIKAYGDYQDGSFAPLSISLSRDNHSVRILLTAEQTNYSMNHDKNFRMHLGDYEKHNLFQFKGLCAEKLSFLCTCSYGCVV